MTVAENRATLGPAPGAAASRPRACSTAVLALLCLGGYAFVSSAVVYVGSRDRPALGPPTVISPTAPRHALCLVLGQLWHSHERELDALVQAR
jgi:hypothetical protein